MTCRIFLVLVFGTLMVFSCKKKEQHNPIEASTNERSELLGDYTYKDTLVSFTQPVSYQTYPVKLKEYMSDQEKLIIEGYGGINETLLLGLIYGDNIIHLNIPSQPYGPNDELISGIGNIRYGRLFLSTNWKNTDRNGKGIK